MNKRKAAEKWIGEFNAMPQSMIAKIWQSNIDDMHELTKPRVGDYAFHYPSQESGEIVQFNAETEEYGISIGDEIVHSTIDDITVEHDDGLPMWGTMWSFGTKMDDYWLEEQGGIQQMSDCGFRIYEHEEFGYFFGIDGAGYDFYEQHWIPLYEARGLQWHDKELETALGDIQQESAVLKLREVGENRFIEENTNDFYTLKISDDNSRVWEKSNAEEPRLPLADGQVIEIWGLGDAGTLIYREQITQKVETISVGTITDIAPELTAKSTTENIAGVDFSFEEIKAATPEQGRQNTVEHRNYEKIAELFPQLESRECSYLHLEAGAGMMPLSVEWIGNNQLSMMHTYTQNGDLMYDPMITLEVDKQAKTATAVEFEQSYPPIYQRISDDGIGHSIDGNGNERSVNNLQEQLNSFTSQWLENIGNQGYMPERANMVIDGEDVRISFDKDGNPIMPEPEPSDIPNADVPIYKFSFEIAQQNDDVEAYWSSHRVNVACGEAIDKAISDSNYELHRYDLKAAARDVIAEFGADRVAWVIATNVQDYNHDGRLSAANKDWAKEFDVSSRPDYHLKTHLSVLDGFINRFREVEKEKPSLMTALKTGEEKSKKEHDKTQPNLDAAQKPNKKNREEI